MPTPPLAETDTMLVYVHTLPDGRKDDVGTCTNPLARYISSWATENLL